MSKKFEMKKMVAKKETHLMGSVISSLTLSGSLG